MRREINCRRERVRRFHNGAVSVSPTDLCAHCKLPLPARPYREEAEGHVLAFCCFGCLTVYRLVGSGGDSGRAGWFLAKLGLAAVLSGNVMMFQSLLYFGSLDSLGDQHDYGPIPTREMQAIEAYLQRIGTAIGDWRNWEPWPTNSRPVPTEPLALRVARGKQAFEKKCWGCHGKFGNGRLTAADKVSTEEGKLVYRVLQCWLPRHGREGRRPLRRSVGG